MRIGKKINHKIRIRRDWCLWIIMSVLMVTVAIGETEEQAADITIEQVYQAEQIDSQVTPGGAIQSLTFKKDMRIRDALTFLSLKYDKNIVPSPNVDGTLAFTSLFNVTFEQALDAILGDHFKHEYEGNLIRVYTKGEYKKMKEDKDRMINKVFKLYYISAAEVMKLVAPVLSGVGTIQASSPAETVVPTGESISSGSGGGDTMALNDMIVIRDYPENIQQAEELIEQLDTRPRQVLLEATILSVLLDEDTRFGIDWNTLNGVAITSLTGIASATKTGAEAVGFATIGNGFRAGVTKNDVVAIITALETVTDTTLMANPKILAVNKQLGQVYIGTKIGYVSQTTQVDTSTTQEVEFLETGTKLSFRPYIGNDGYIRIDIHPKDSSGTLKTNSIPDETSTELMTNIMVKDGETIVIGGLFRDIVATTRYQIPILGDLPLIGVLFRGTNDETQREEVIIMLTPHIIEEPDETMGKQAEDDVRRLRLGAKEELQWIERRRLAEDRYSDGARYYLEGNYKKALQELDAAIYLRPTYSEAIRLKERILEETDPERAAKLERKILDEVEKDWQFH